MKRKIILNLIAVVAIVAGVVALSAFEAHVINVTAHIENALSVDTEHIDFDTVFPQEYATKQFTLALSNSFMQGQTRLDSVDYVIKQKPKPGYSDLCPFLSKMNNEADGLDGHGNPIPENDISRPSYFIDPDNNPGHPDGDEYCQTPNPIEASGKLVKSTGDNSDLWVLDLKVPPIEGSVGQDWPKDCPTIPAEADYGCDLWIEVTGISERDLSLVGLWHLNEGAGNKAFDASNYGNHGTIYGATWTPGSMALSFDGIDDYVEVANHSSLQINSAITLSLWIKTPSSWNKEYPTPISKAKLSGDWDGEYWIAIRAQGYGWDNRFTFSFAPAGQSAIDHWSNTKLAFNTWYHIVATFDDNANKVKLYLNGVLDKEFTENATPGITNLPVRIGHGGYSNNYFKGIVDEVRIYNRVLGSDEIYQLYLAGR